MLAILKKSFKKAVTMQVVKPEERPDGDERESHVGIWGENVSGRGNTQCKRARRLSQAVRTFTVSICQGQEFRQGFFVVVAIKNPPTGELNQLKTNISADLFSVLFQP